MNVARVAVVFDNRPRPETTGTYVRRALGTLVREGRLASVDHFLPEEVPLLPPDLYDLFLYVDDGLTREFAETHRPIAWWAIDTHLGGPEYLRLAQSADYVFTAQRNGADVFRGQGVAATWLPLAADPGIHEPFDLPMQFDVSFVGHENGGLRNRLLERLRQEFPSHFIGRAYFESLSRVYSASRTVFNCSIVDDINMRVFEALACGSLLITNDLTDNGLAELLRDGEHLVTYRDEPELVDRLHWLLAHDDERQRIARAGHEEVLTRHTYRHRLLQLLESIATVRPEPGVIPGYFEHSRPEVLELVPRSARCVLDIGCGAGRLGATLRERQSASVTGVEFDEQAAKIARSRLDKVVCGDIETTDIDFKSQSFDAVVCADILEHLRDPAGLLRRIREWLSPDGVLVTSLPNVRHHSVVRSLLEGNFTYESAGLLDKTHLRFFTRREMEKLLFRAGFEIVTQQIVPGAGHAEWVAEGRRPEISVSGFSYRGRDAVDAEEFLAYQFLTVAQPVARPTPVPLTSIVLVTHGELRHTIACIESIRLLTDEPVELIVVDNASPDNSVAWLRQQSDVQLIENPDNRGFPAAVNQGVAIATGQQVLLLNNDTIVTTGWLRRMLDALDADERIGLVGPVSNNVSGPQQIATGYDELTLLDGWAWDWSQAHLGETEDHDRLVGFCLLIDRAVIEQLEDTDGRLLDERFGIGCFEDDDLCRRARAAGFRTVVARDAFVHHVGSATFRSRGVDLARVLETNEKLFAEKWRTQSGVRLSLCMIVRDNERTIRPALESIRPWVDEMIVVDTGSRDGTAEICRELGAKVLEFAWCDDFSAARNESFRHAAGEWLFWMDSDDTIDAVNGRGLRKLADGNHEPTTLGYVVQVHCPGDGPHDLTAVDHVKLVRNRPDVRFEHRIHEQLLPAIRRVNGDVQFTDLFVVHSGSDRTPEGRAGKIERDLRILEKDLAERPEHPFVLFNLGMTYADIDQPEEAVEFLRRSVSASGENESHVPKAFALMVASLFRASRFDEAWDVCSEGLQRFPDDIELGFRSAMLHQHFGRFPAAVAGYRSLLQDSGDRKFASVDLGLQGLKARHNLAIVYEEMERPTAAAEEWQKILAEHRDYRPAWRGLLENRIAAGDLDGANEVLELAQAAGIADVMPTLGARIAEVNGQTRAAIAGLRGSNDEDALVLLCRLEFEYGTPQDAEQALRRLLEAHPDDPAALHNLGALMVRERRMAEAIAPLRRSLEIRPQSTETRALFHRTRQEQARLESGSALAISREEP